MCDSDSYPSLSQGKLYILDEPRRFIYTLYTNILLPKSEVTVTVTQMSLFQKRKQIYCRADQMFEYEMLRDVSVVYLSNNKTNGYF